MFVDRAGAQSIWSLMASIAELLVREGHEPMFCVFDDGGSPYSHPVPDGVEKIVIPVPPKRYLWDLYAQHRIFGLAFQALLRQRHPDVVHTNFCVPGIMARWIAVREHVPVVVSTQHELYGSMRPHYRWGLRLTEHCADAVVYVSNTVAHSFGRKNGQVRDKTQHWVIANGVDIEYIRSAILGIGPPIPGKLVCAGRMVRVKGQETLIRALPSVVSAHPEVYLSLIGTGPDENHLRQLVSDLNLKNHVRFAGWLSRETTFREMATAQAVVVPSDGTQEGFGLVLVEATLCCAFVVASDIPVFQEVAADAGEGLRWFPPGDIDALTVVLINLLKIQTTTPLASLGAIDRRYSVERMVIAYCDMYKALIIQKTATEY